MALSWGMGTSPGARDCGCSARRGSCARCGSRRSVGLTPLQWIGRHSYSWYLWHWPILVGAGVLWPAIGVGGKLVAAMVALGAAALGYALVENRIRFHPYLVARPRVSLGLAGLLSVAAIAIALSGRHYAHIVRKGRPKSRLCSPSGTSPICTRPSVSPTRTRRLSRSASSAIRPHQSRSALGRLARGALVRGHAADC